MAVDRDALELRLRDLFLDELDEHVLTLNEGLVALEQQGSSSSEDPVVHEVFRAAHSLKGAAHSAGVHALVGLCHHLEDSLSSLRDGTLSPTTAVIGPLLDAVDALSTAGRCLRDGAELSAADVAWATQGLVALADSTVLIHRASEGMPLPPTGDDEPLVDEPLVGDPAASVAATARLAPNIRVSAERLNDLLNDAGEVVLAGRRVHALANELVDATQAALDPHGTAVDTGARLEQLDRLARSTASASRTLTAGGLELADSVRRTRMTPLVHATSALDRIARDASLAAHKDVHLHLHVGDVEVDRGLLEVISDALLHLVRNAIDHGIESPAQRVAANKPALGHVTVRAVLEEHNGVSISVEDDGRGLDVDALRGLARQRNIAVPLDDTGSDDVAGLAEVAFLPGVSTSPTITGTSGRGVGLDAVRARVEAVGGTAALRSNVGSGTVVTLTLPLGLFAVRALFFSVGGEVLALPTSGITRLLRLAVDDLQPLGEGHVVLLDGRAVPVMWLETVVDLPAPAGARKPPYSALVVGEAPHDAVFLVDELLTEEEVVLKPLGRTGAAIRGVLGATILTSGRVALVLNPSVCVRAGRARTAASASPVEWAPTRRQRVLLAEDSITTRALERSILESAGYEVIVAVDGAEAWELLEAQGADIVVSDTNMPRMEGLELCAAVRRSPRFHALPFVLVTSLASEEDRRRGIEAGADAYIVKADFDRALLLDTLERLL